MYYMTTNVVAAVAEHRDYRPGAYGGLSQKNQIACAQCSLTPDLPKLRVSNVLGSGLKAGRPAAPH